MHSLSGADLARKLGISRARVSQLVAEGKLEGAYAGEGRNRRFDLQVAARLLNRTLDAGQVMGNGADAAEARRAIADEAGEPSRPAEPAPAPDDAAALDDDIANARYRRARADRAEIEAIKARINLALDEGRYVLASEVELATRRAIAAELAEVESVLRAAAQAIAAEHGLDARAVKARVFALWRAHRGRRAAASRDAADAAAPTPGEAVEMQVA